MNNITGDSACAERELLLGMPEIAGFLGLSVKQAQYLRQKGVLPVFKLGGGRVCAKSSSLLHWLETIDQPKAA